MKAKTILKVLPLAVLLLSGCYNEIENELGLLERRIESLEQAVSKMQTNVNSLQTMVEALDSHDFVTRITTNRRLDGSIESYTIHFSHSSPITIYNGIDAETPVLGVKKADDGLYYWTITYPSTGVTEFVENNFGVMVPATTSTPELKIENGKWMVNYDGYAWESLGQATGTDGTSFLESIEESTDFIRFTLKDGTVLNFPTWDSYEKLVRDIDAAKANYASLDSLKEILESKVFVNDIIPVVSPGADTLGYKLLFSDGRELEFHNGVATNRPVISARPDSSEAGNPLCWCISYDGGVHYEWLTFTGWKIKAEADTSAMPQIGIKKAEDNLYYWAVKYPGTSDFVFLYDRTSGVNEKVQASAAENNRLIDQVIVSETYVTIKSGGVEYCVPRFNDFSVSFDLVSNTMLMPAGASRDFYCTIAAGNDNYTVLPVASDGFYAEVSTSDYKEWKVTVTSPANFTSSRLTLLISDGRGTTKTFVITINKN